MGLRLRCRLQCVVQPSRSVRAIGVPRHTFPILAARTGAVRSRKREEPGTTPGRAGDGAGDGREARIGRALPVKSIGRDDDGVALPPIVANEHRAGFEPAAGRAAVARQTLQERQAFPIKAAKGPFLHAPGDHSPQQVLAQSRRRRSSEDRSPAPPKGIKRKRAQARDLGLDRGRLVQRCRMATRSAGPRCQRTSCRQQSDTRARRRSSRTPAAARASRAPRRPGSRAPCAAASRWSA
jgi:hypothetical protein